MARYKSRVAMPSTNFWEDTMKRILISAAAIAFALSLAQPAAAETSVQQDESAHDEKNRGDLLHSNVTQHRESAEQCGCQPDPPIQCSSSSHIFPKAEAEVRLKRL